MRAPILPQMGSPKEAAGARARGHWDGTAEIIARGRRRAVLDDRGAEAILGYDDDGLPT